MPVPAPRRRRASRRASTRPTSPSLTALRAGNAAYEQKFGRIYLVRAKGRTGPQLLTMLHERLDNDPETELGITTQQLREIAVLRVEGLFA